MTERRRVTLVYPRSGDPADAIDQYCVELANAFGELGWSAHRSERVDRDAAEADLLLVQYNPFGYGLWGFAPALPAALARLRRGAGRPVTALVVHERFVPIEDARSLLMGGWQRAQLLAVRAQVDAVFYPVEAYKLHDQGWWPRLPSEHLPVGSTLPDRRADRVATRLAHGWSEQTLVVATLGSHVSKVNDWIAPALEAVADSGRPTVHADLGARPINVRVPGVERFAPGFLEAPKLAAHLAAADLLLAPFTDGISGRRTTVMAALRNELAVLSTVDEHSDRLLAAADSGLTLVSSDDAEGFLRAARELAEDDAARGRRAARGTALYEERLDWPVTARRLARTERRGARAA